MGVKLKNLFLNKKFKIYLGKTGFYNFTISSIGSTSYNCDSSKVNCKICYNSDKCIKCNNDYFLNEYSNSCESSLSDGFYLDINTQTHKKCHQNCETCSEGPIYFKDRLEYEDTNCLTCINGYFKIENSNNCLDKNNLPLGYYFNEQNNLITKCHNNCKTCSDSNTNDILFNCLECDENRKFYEKSKNCLDCVLRNKYVNFMQTDCIDEIPEGYYLFNDEYKSIDICYISCKNCNEKGNENDHKCLECSDEYPYNYKNLKCLKNCYEDNLFSDEEDNKCYDDCNENTNERKYGYNNKCYSLEDLPTGPITEYSTNIIITNIITTDIITTEIIIKNNELININTESESSTEKYNYEEPKLPIINEINNCNNLFYKKDNQIFCIDSKVCPNNLPYLKYGNKECTNCPLEYKGKCFTSCPEGTCISQNNPNLDICIDKKEGTQIISGLCFDDFSEILNNFDDNSIIANSQNPSITINIYQNEIDMNDAKDKNPNLTLIDLGECSDKLKEFYHLKPTEKLYLLQLDVTNIISNQPINNTNFKIYLSNKTELKDLSACFDTTISLTLPIKDLISLILKKLNCLILKVMIYIIYLQNFIQINAHLQVLMEMILF